MFLEKYNNFRGFEESLIWSVNQEEVSFDEILKISGDDKSIVVSADVDEWDYEANDDISFEVSMNAYIKYGKTYDNSSGWILHGSLSAYCNEHNDYDHEDGFEEEFAKFANKTSVIDSEDASTDEDCMYPDFTVYPTFQEALKNIHLPIDYFIKRLNARGEILSNIFE